MVLEASPGALTFSHDILLNIPLIVEWQTISFNREELLNDTLLRNNQRHINYNYFFGQHTLEYDQTVKGKLAIKTSSSFEMYMFMWMVLSWYNCWLVWLNG